jgi:hypothetical protein
VFDERCLLQKKLIDVKFYLKFNVHSFHVSSMEESLHAPQSARLRSTYYECTFPLRVNSDVIPVTSFAKYISLPFTVCYELDIRPGDADNDINRNTCCAVLIRKIRSISILLVLASSSCPCSCR